jgi:integrase
MPVIAIGKRIESEPSGQPSGKPASPARKSLKANQKSLDDVPLASGTWQVEGVQGLYLRARAKSKSFFLQRRVNGELLNRTIGEMSMKDAKEKASNIWPSMKQQRSATVHVTFAQAFESYMEQADLAEATIKNYRINFSTHLKEWHDRPVSDIGTQREDLRFFHQRLRKNHRDSIANQVRRLLSTIYNYHRDGSNDDTLPAFPKKAVPLFSIPARDWAFDDDQLRVWWHTTVETKDGKVEQGVKTLSLVKRLYWLTSLFTGARPRSIENLKWTDIDFDKRTIRFRVTKGERPYTVPMADALHRILAAYRDSDSRPPSEWAFPSDRNTSGHLIDVKNEKEGVDAKYHLRHTFKTRLTGLGYSNEQGKLLMGHSLGGDVATGYITAPLLIESLRPVANAVADHYLSVVPEIRTI